MKEFFEEYIDEEKLFAKKTSYQNHAIIVGLSLRDVEKGEKEYRLSKEKEKEQKGG